MEYIRQVDFAALAALPASERPVQSLLDVDSGSDRTRIRYIIQRPGARSPSGRHTHVEEQIYYILSGVMDFEIDGKMFKAVPGSLVVLPAGLPHENWNAGTESVAHLTMDVPAPDPKGTFAIPAAPLRPIERTL